jgi:membrane fusion protein, macrolide-specific efflux system
MEGVIMLIHRRLTFIGLPVIALLVAVALSWNGTQNSNAHLLTAPVTMGDLDQIVLAVGRLQPKELISVGAQVTGQLQQLHVQLGQQVKAGDLIAEVDAQPQRLQLRNAEASVTSLQAQQAARQASLIQAELAYTRQQNLMEADATARAEVEAARAALDVIRAEISSLQAQIEQAHTQVESARTNLAYTRIVAPMDGVVVSVVTKQGQTLNSFQSAPTIVVIARLDVMTVRARIAEADVDKVQPGQTVRFTTLGQNRRYEAKIEQIEPAPESIINEASSSTTDSGTARAIYYNALFDVPNPDGHLKPSMTAQVSVLVSQETQVILVPIAALGERTDDSYSVRVLEPSGEVASRLVRIGATTASQAVVISGLMPGEQVVLGEADPANAPPQSLMGM